MRKIAINEKGNAGNEYQFGSIGRWDKAEDVWVEIDNCHMSASSLAWQVAQIRVKRGAFPAQGKLDIHLRNTCHMKGDTGAHSNRMRRKTSQGLLVRDVNVSSGIT